ncbi:TolC family protein [bacterium]|nr:TolC family protein [bacterium]
MSFTGALAALRRDNETLKAARSEIDQLRHERNAARALYFPTIAADARYTRIDQAITIDLAPIRAAILGLHPQVPAEVVPEFETVVQDDAFWQARLTATWPIFTGGRILAANRAAGAQLSRTQEKRRATEQSLTSELARRYFGLRLAGSVRDVRRAVLDGMERHLFEARRLEEEGLISEAERLHAEVARAEAERALQAALRDEETVRIGLASLLASDDAIEPTTGLFVIDSMEPLAVFRDHAASRHPGLGQLAAQRAMAGERVRAEKSRWLPDIFLFGIKELHREDLTLLDPEWAVGVGAGLTLFDGLARTQRVQAARSLQQRVAHLEDGTRRDISALVEQRYNELMKAREQFVSLETSRSLAKESLRVRRRGFEEGMSASLDVVDAQLSLSRVEVARLAAAYDFDVRLAELLEASGQSERFVDYLSGPDQEVER